ncbi:S49 family peptidase [Actinomycetospora endophytica]|uniref:S49 family peptidase n=1 Tax=Actinomycetospora endophytica TaxID=2291215 RepID=A0ABS8P4T3_9PSEU|nr:S49 family peptidase [Actinomycetospora endophytica]MCD2193263.1 S49 family peptidase [Actinomycetospora endophytica]
MLPGVLASKVGGGTVSVVRLNGIIASASGPVPRSVINLQAVESALVRAFEAENAVAVALVINSPGGSPTQSQLVADRIRGLAAEHELPVLAFCEDVAASGGYWLACAADEIFACPTSLVGSIGVVSGGFGLTGLIERFGIERRLHTAGANKARLDPFQPEKPEDVEWLLGMQGELHELFIEWVRSRREGLDESADLFTGEVWTGRRALELGLIDGIGSPHEILSQRYPDAEPVGVEPRKPLLARLGVGVLGGVPGLGASSLDPAAAVVGALEFLEQRAHWSRFGL